MEKQESKMSGVTVPPKFGVRPSVDIARAMVERYAAELYALKQSRVPLTDEQRSRMPELRSAARLWTKLVITGVVLAALSGCGAGIGFSHNLTLHRVDEIESSQKTYRADNETGFSCLWRDCGPVNNSAEVVHGS